MTKGVTSLVTGVTSLVIPSGGGVQRCLSRDSHARAGTTTGLGRATVDSSHSHETWRRRAAVKSQVL